MWDKHKKSGSNILYYPLLPPQDRYERPPFLPPFLPLFIYIYILPSRLPNMKEGNLDPASISFPRAYLFSPFCLARIHMFHS